MMAHAQQVKKQIKAQKIRPNGMQRRFNNHAKEFNKFKERINREWNEVKEMLTTIRNILGKKKKSRDKISTP